jgi:hypothetical protein
MQPRVRRLRLPGVDTGHMATYNLRMSNAPAAVEVRVVCDKAGSTLTVWFGDPQDEYVCEETGDEVVLMKNKSGRVIGFEKLNWQPLEGGEEILVRVIPERGELARRLLGAGREFAPERDAVAELIEERAAEG